MSVVTSREMSMAWATLLILYGCNTCGNEQMVMMIYDVSQHSVNQRSHYLTRLRSSAHPFRVVHPRAEGVSDIGVIIG
jgi:hypothetical protein